MTIRMSVIGPLMGIGFAILTIKFLEANQDADSDANVETICTLAVPFLVFYLAETAFGSTFQMSGVLAVVSYGLVFAAPYGKVRLDPGVEHFLHGFWAMVGHLTNTIIFVIAGSKLGMIFVEAVGTSYARAEPGTHARVPRRPRHRRDRGPAGCGRSPRRVLGGVCVRPHALQA